MGERYRLVVKNGEMHLLLDEFFDKDCGSLHKTFSGKLVTRNWFGGNYELEDISGWFSSGQKYRFKKPNGEQGTLVKSGGSYEYIPD